MSPHRENYASETDRAHTNKLFNVPQVIRDREKPDPGDQDKKDARHPNDSHFLPGLQSSSGC